MSRRSSSQIIGKTIPPEPNRWGPSGPWLRVCKKEEKTMSIRITVPEEHEKFCISYAKDMSTKESPVTPEAAALKIFNTGVVRKKALSNYAESPKGKRAAKAAKPAKAKAAPKAKAAKAKAAPAKASAKAAPAKAKARAKIGGSKPNGAAANSLLNDNTAS